MAQLWDWEAVRWIEEAKGTLWHLREDSTVGFGPTRHRQTLGVPTFRFWKVKVQLWQDRRCLDSEFSPPTRLRPTFPKLSFFTLFTLILLVLTPEYNPFTLLDAIPDYPTYGDHDLSN